MNAVAVMANEGKSELDIATEYPVTYMMHSTGVRRIIELFQIRDKPVDRELKVTLVMGPTGCGKTRVCYSEPEKTFKMNGFQLKNFWWDGYDNEEILLIDEYSNQCSIDVMLAMLDRYDLRLPVKGGFKQAHWVEVFITSNLHWEQIHENAKPEHRLALRRRIHKIVNLWETIQLENWKLRYEAAFA